MCGVCWGCGIAGLQDIRDCVETSLLLLILEQLVVVERLKTSYCCNYCIATVRTLGTAGTVAYIGLWTVGDIHILYLELLGHEYILYLEGRKYIWGNTYMGKFRLS